MKTGVYKVQSKTEPEKYLIIDGNDPENILEYLLIPLREGQYSGERLQDHFNIYGEKDLECSIIIACNNNFLASLTAKEMIETANPYFNGVDPIVVIDKMPEEIEEFEEIEEAVLKQPKMEKAIIKQPIKKPRKKRENKKLK